MNGERGYHFFSSLVWRNWTATAALSGGNKIQPVSWGSSIFNDRGTQVSDGRDFVEAVYARQIDRGLLQWRTYYDSFHFLGREDYALGDGAVKDNRTDLLGNWIGTQLTYRFRPLSVGDITVGVESKIDIRNLQRDYDVSPVPVTYLNTSRLIAPSLFSLRTKEKLSRRWTLESRNQSRQFQVRKRSRFRFSTRGTNL